MHLRLDLHSFLPEFVIVKAAKTHDSTEAKELCAGMKAGEVGIFDKAYVDFPHLNILHKRGVFWVTRAKDNMQYEVMGQHTSAKGKIIRDIRIRLIVDKSSKAYPEDMRLVEANVVIDGKERIMTYITNNFDWSPNSICDLYKARWLIEIFFKQIKQTLQLADFLGYNENAVKWQLWIALLTYILLRYIAYIQEWAFSFPRLFTVLRGVMWNYYDMIEVLKCCGTAGAPIRVRAAPEHGFLPGFTPI